jgi:sodium-dependent dicarboxylate transporter 2/3/5
MLFGFPLALILMLVVWRILIVIFPMEAAEGAASKLISPQGLTRSPMSRQEKATLSIIVLVVVLLISAPLSGIDADSVALFGAALFLVGGILPWKSVQRNIDWGTIIFFDAALSVGNDFIATLLAGRMNLTVTTFVIPSAVACSLSFMLPMADPSIAMAYGTGFVSTRDVFKAGLPVTIVAICVSIPVILVALHLI